MAVEKQSNHATQHGGKRPGAGRKSGVPNKRTAEIQKEVEQSGMTPLQYMLTIMRDDGQDEARRLAAANMAAPYVHAKLASIEMSADMRITKKAEELTDDELAHLATISGE